MLLTNGLLYDPYRNVKTNDSILVEDGIVKKIGKIENTDSMQVIDCSKKIITPGFIDIHAHFREPGREDKETLLSGSYSALAGGFTTVCVMPNTDPPLDTPESIRYIVEKSRNLPIKILPIGAITVKQLGKEMTEIGKMVKAGAIAISDDGLPVQNGQVLRYAMQYAKKFNIPVINHAEDIHIRNNGIMNEGSISTLLGLPGNPDISESIMVFRDLEIAEFVNGNIHIPHVSTKRSVELIKEYKKIGVNVTAEVTPHHLGLTEHDLKNYDTNSKVAPPLRSEDDRLSLVAGLIDGTIDCIATDHAPHTLEEKEMDIIHAPCGMIGLESAFGLSHTILSRENVTTENIIQWFTKGPSSIFGWNINAFEINKPANINIIDPNKKWIFQDSDIYSRSKNSPMIGMEFIGKVEATLSGKHTFGNILD